jgi:hypothetical protein
MAGRWSVPSEVPAIAREARAKRWCASHPRGLIRRTVVGHGLIADREVDALLGELEKAKAADYVGAFGSLYVEMIAEIPDPSMASAPAGRPAPGPPTGPGA